MFIEVSLTLQKNFLLICKSFEGLHFKASERHCWVSTVAEDLHIDREMKCKYKLLSIITLQWIIEQNQIAQHWFTHGQLIPCNQIQRLMRLFDLIVHKKYPLFFCYQPLINDLKVNHLQAYERYLWLELITVCTHACLLVAESRLQTSGAS